MILIVPSTDEEYSRGNFSRLVHHTLPFGVAALASVLERDGVRVRVVNDAIHPLDALALRELAKDEPGRPVFGMSSLTLQAHRSKELCRIIKAEMPEAFVVAGGIHATNMPMEFMDAGFDYVMRGEGEFVIRDLAVGLAAGEDISALPGLCWRDEAGTVRQNQAGKQLVDLADLPPFPFHLFEDDVAHYDMGVIMSSRGCPYKCIFCSQRSMTGVSYRVKPIEVILEELDTVINRYGVKHVYFIEDNFVVNKKRTMDLCDRMIAKGFHAKASFLCQFRGDAADPVVLEKLKEANFTTVSMGIETGSERMATFIQKGETVETNRRAVHMAKAHGLKVAATFIIGFPQETHKDRMETIRLALSLPLDVMRVNIAIPYPGTPLYEMVKDSVRIDEGWRNFNVVSPLVTGPFKALPLPYVPEGSSADELRFLMMWTNLRFWLKPASFVRFITSPSTGVTRFPPAGTSTRHSCGTWRSSGSMSACWSAGWQPWE